MKFFVDTADLDDIKDLGATGMLDGVTTNPSLIKKAGQEFIPLIEEICKIVEGPVSAEVTALETDKMIVEAKSLAKIADNVTVKLPLTFDGLAACKALTSEGIKTNVTLCFSANQALLAAKARKVRSRWRGISADATPTRCACRRAIARLLRAIRPKTKPPNSPIATATR